MSSTFKAHLAMLSAALIYGANYSIAKVILDDQYIQPLNLVMLRITTGAILFALLHRLFVKERIARADIGRLLLCALTGVFVNQCFFITGLKFTTPINAALIMTTTPILVLIASSLIIREKITSLKVGGIALGITGAIGLILMKNGDATWSFGSLKGDLMIFLNAMSYGIYLVLVKSLMKKYQALTVVKWVFLFGLIFMFPFGISGMSSIEWSSFSPLVWGSLAFVLLATTVLAYLFNAFALKIVNPSVVSVYIYLQPLFATMIALFWGKDTLTWEKIVAGVLIFTGVYLVSRQKK